MKSTESAASQRGRIIENVITTVQKRFYDPGLHGADLRSAFQQRMQELLECPEAEFAAQIEKTLGVLQANPVKFYHSSQKRVPTRWAIRATFQKIDENSQVQWMFQDVAPGGPAHAAGLEPGDVLKSLNGRVPLHPPDLAVGRNEIAVRKRNGSMEMHNFVAPSPLSGRAVFHSRLKSTVGYLRLTHLPGLVGIDLARDIDVAMAELSNCSTLIVDLRGNPGGGTGGLRLMSYLTPAKLPVGYSLTRRRAEAGYFREQLTTFGRIPSGKWTLPLLALKYRFIDHSIVVVTEGLGKRRFHGNVVMIVNEHTTSGAEIIAGFAADHGLATIVGSATAGTLLGWRSFPLDSGYVLVIPTGNYLTWEGKSFEGTGVQPHVEAHFDVSAAQQGSDVQLKRALEVVKSN